jgi:hypothetical protein
VLFLWNLEGELCLFHPFGSLFLKNLLQNYYSVSVQTTFSNFLIFLVFECFCIMLHFIFILGFRTYGYIFRLKPKYVPLLRDTLDA